MHNYTFSTGKIRSLQIRAKGLELSADARKRLKWFYYYATHNKNISQTCRYYGIARSTFIRWASRFDEREPETLEDHSRKPHTVRTSEVPLHVIAAIRTLRSNSPYIARADIAKELKAHGVEISVATVGRIISKKGMYFGDTESHKQKRNAWISRNTDTDSFAPFTLTSHRA